MPTDPGFAAFVEDQLRPLPVRLGRMFGEYAVYLDDRVVGFICDDTLFLKPVLEGEAAARLESRTGVGKPYPTAKDYRAVHGDALDDRDWLQVVVREVADALPPPAPKRPKTPRRVAD